MTTKREQLPLPGMETENAKPDDGDLLGLDFSTREQLEGFFKANPDHPHEQTCLNAAQMKLDTMSAERGITVEDLAVALYFRFEQPDAESGQIHVRVGLDRAALPVNPRSRRAKQQEADTENG